MSIGWERCKGFSVRVKKSGTGWFFNRDKVNLDIFWLKDKSLEDSANLPAPDIIAAEIVEDLQAALEQFAEIAADLRTKESQP
jgi:type I restriction enzyme M protein